MTLVCMCLNSVPLCFTYAEKTFVCNRLHRMRPSLLHKQPSGYAFASGGMYPYPHSRVTKRFG